MEITVLGIATAVGYLLIAWLGWRHLRPKRKDEELEKITHAKWTKK